MWDSFKYQKMDISAMNVLIRRMPIELGTAVVDDII